MRKQKSGTMICFVGIDGSGKTTHALALCRELSAKGINCMYVRPRYALLRFLPSIFREWGDKHTYISPRNIMIPSEIQKTRKVSRYVRIFKIPLTLFFLIYASFTYFLDIRPLLSEFIIVCDRYFFDWLYNLWGKVATALTHLLPKPNLVVLLDIPVATALSRMHDIEDKSISPNYYRSLQSWYLVLARQREFFVIDSSSDFEKTKQQILNRILIYLGSDDWSVQ